MTKRYIEPWFPMSCMYFRNGKVEDAGPAAAMCHLYLIAETRREGADDSGSLPMDVWKAKKIYRWCGIFREKFTLKEIEQGMEKAIDENLVDIIDGNNSKWIRPHDNEDYVNAVARKEAAEKKRKQRAQKKDNRGHVPGCPGESVDVPISPPKEKKEKKVNINSELPGMAKPLPDPNLQKGLTNRQKAFLHVMNETDIFVAKKGSIKISEAVSDPIRFAQQIGDDIAYPAVEPGELVKAAIWTFENQKRAKVKIGAFISGWLGRTQERSSYKQQNQRYAPSVPVPINNLGEDERLRRENNGE